MAQFVFSVPDMSCGHCKMRITKALEEAGFSAFDVALETKTVTVEAADSDAVRAAIDEAGYDAVLKQ
ncbi:MAG: heavy-metal-associated domain-containing protein [Aminivibrio sp.]|jgi:copper chaperone|nr:heavy-metal-associated domain-containing protein [Aminivibrio sp.]